jgi:hypothetical protein
MRERDTSACIRRHKAFALASVGLNRPISVYRFPRRALTLCPQLCMGIQSGTRFPARSANALFATLYGYFTQAIYETEIGLLNHTTRRATSVRPWGEVLGAVRRVASTGVGAPRVRAGPCRRGGAVRVDRFSRVDSRVESAWNYALEFMTKCVKPLRHLATSCNKSCKWSVLIGRAGTKSD